MKIKNIAIPDGLHPLALAQMRTIIGTLAERGVLEESDGAALAMLSGLLSKYYKATEILNASPLIVENARGELKQHPAAKIQSDAAQRAVSILSEMGFTVKSRSRLAGMLPGDPSPLDDFFRGND